MARLPDMPGQHRWLHGMRARYVCGCRCYLCRTANRLYHRQRASAISQGRANPLVDASRARAHLLALSDAAIGRRSVERVSGVGDTVLQSIKSGRKRQIRAETERRILAVPFDAQAPNAHVPAARTWERVRYLMQHGWKKYRIAEAIGQHRALQLGKDHCSARHAAAILKLYLETRKQCYRPVQILTRQQARHHARVPFTIE